MVMAMVVLNVMSVSQSAIVAQTVAKSVIPNFLPSGQVLTLFIG